MCGQRVYDNRSGDRIRRTARLGKWGNLPASQASLKRFRLDRIVEQNGINDYERPVTKVPKVTEMRCIVIESRNRPARAAGRICLGLQEPETVARGKQASRLAKMLIPAVEKSLRHVPHRRRGQAGHDKDQQEDHCTQCAEDNHGCVHLDPFLLLSTRGAPGLGWWCSASRRGKRRSHSRPETVSHAGSG